MLNIQSPSSFDSHRLNRDTWRDPTLEAMIQAAFVVYQTYDVSEDGQSLMSFYNITSLPVIIMVDPVTGAPMRQWNGFQEATRLAEDFVPFMDIRFDDPGAARLAASSMRRKQGSKVEQGGARHVGEEERAIQEAIAASMRQPSACHLVDDEDKEEEGKKSDAGADNHQLHSDHQLRGNPGEDMDQCDHDNHDDVLIEQTSVSAEQVAAEAAASLPKDDSGPGMCRIGMCVRSVECIHADSQL